MQTSFAQFTPSTRAQGRRRLADRCIDLSPPAAKPTAPQALDAQPGTIVRGQIGGQRAHNTETA
jgi:hypothetical protein